MSTNERVTLKKWRNFSIGGVEKELLLQIEPTKSVATRWALDMISQEAFKVQSEVEEIETIILTPKDLDFEAEPTSLELFNDSKLREWSKKNSDRLPSGYKVELLPQEAGPHIRNQYQEQLKGEVIWIATKPMLDSRQNSCVFGVYWGVFGIQWLASIFVRPDEHWFLGTRLVFRLVKQL